MFFFFFFVSQILNVSKGNSGPSVILQRKFWCGLWLVAFWKGNSLGGCWLPQRLGMKHFWIWKKKQSYATITRQRRSRSKRGQTGRQYPEHESHSHQSSTTEHKKTINIYNSSYRTGRCLCRHHRFVLKFHPFYR